MPILTGKARLAGIVGWPVAHSRSPRIHGHWLARYGIDGAYLPMPVRPTDFAAAIAGLRAAGFAGLNVTLPHKLAALAICDSVDPEARRIGAVNTITFGERSISGTNTDGFGFLAALQEAGVAAMTGPALVLGAGGAARAVVAVLVARGIKVTIANRTRAHAETLSRDLPGSSLVSWEARSEAVADHALLVNTTSLGMQGWPSLDIDLAGARPDLVVADIVYTPLETPLLAAARARGLRTVDGLGMLLHQARPGFAAWFGVDPVVDAELRRFVLADLEPG